MFWLKWALTLNQTSLSKFKQIKPWIQNILAVKWYQVEEKQRLIDLQQENYKKTKKWRALKFK